MHNRNHRRNAEFPPVVRHNHESHQLELFRPAPPRRETAGTLLTSVGPMLLGIRTIEGSFGPDCGTGTGAGGFAGRCEGVPYLAMLLDEAGSPGWEVFLCMAPTEPLPCMLWGEPKEGVLPAEGLIRGT